MKPWRITVHCSATKNGDSVSAKQIDEWHRMRGFDRIGYHMTIDVDGTVEYGRGLNVQGAHVSGANEGNIGICLIGTNTFSDRQFTSLEYKLDSLFLLFDIRPWELHCHNEFPSAISQGKTCPGFSVTRLYAWYFLKQKTALLPFIGRAV